MSKFGFRKLVARVARDVGDQAPVGWDALREKDGTLAPELENLRLLESMARLTASAGGEFASGGAALQSGSSDNHRDVRRTGASMTPLFTWGRLQVLEKIGEGGFADVYRAYDPSLEIEVALKLRHADAGQSRRAVERFKREAQILARIRHPHIVRVYGVEEHDDRVGLWMDFVRGETFAQRVREGGPCNATEAAGYGIDLCCALASLHASGLTHRDLKPSNVMREENSGTIFLLDFGSAGDLVSDRAWWDGFQGTPLAAPPEVLVEQKEPQRAADIYGLGIVLYWLVTGRYPVEGQTVDELREKHRNR